MICYETSFISAMYPNFCGFYWSVASHNSYPYTNTLILVLHCLPCTNTHKQTTLKETVRPHCQHFSVHTSKVHELSSTVVSNWVTVSQLTAP